MEKGRKKEEGEREKREKRREKSEADGVGERLVLSADPRQLSFCQREGRRRTWPAVTSWCGGRGRKKKEEGKKKNKKTDKDKNKKTKRRVSRPLVRGGGGRGEVREERREKRVGGKGDEVKGGEEKGKEKRGRNVE